MSVRATAGEIQTQHLQLHFILLTFSLLVIYSVVFKQINLIIMKKKENYIFGLKQNLKIIFLGIVFLSLNFWLGFGNPGHAPYL